MVVTGRDEARGHRAAEEIRRRSGSDRIVLRLANLSSQVEVRRLADDVLAAHPRLHVLVNTAGGLYGERWSTVDGHEASLAMNAVSPFLLTRLLLDRLTASATAEHAARVVLLGTSVHRMAKVRFDDLQAEGQDKPGLAVYGRAKLLGILWAYELARRTNPASVTVNVADPGGADTPMTQAMSPDFLPRPLRFVWPLLKRVGPSGRSPEVAARSSVLAASSTALEGLTGRYVEPSGKLGKSSKASYDLADAARAWQICEELAGLGAELPVRARPGRRERRTAEALARWGDELVGDPPGGVGGIGCRQPEDDVLKARVDRLADRAPGEAGLNKQIGRKIDRVTEAGSRPISAQ